MLEEGGTAPDLSLPGIVDGQPDYYNLYEPLRAGRAVVLLFAPVDFVPTITPDLVAASYAPWCDREGVTTWAITADSLFAHEAYAEHRSVDVPLLTDRFGGVAEAYGVCLEEFLGHRDVPERAAFVVDPEWTVRFTWASDDPTAVPAESPLVGAAETLSSLLDASFDAPRVDYG